MIASRRHFLGCTVAAFTFGFEPVGHTAGTLPPIVQFATPVSGFIHATTSGLTGVAVAKGFLDAEFAGTGTNVQTQYLTGVGPAVNEGLANKHVDIGHEGGLTSIICRAGGIDIKIIVADAIPGSLYLAVRPDLPVKSFADLNGHLVGVTNGTYLHMSLLRLLAQAGVGEHDVRLMELSSADQLAAIAARQIDAILTSNIGLELQARGQVKIVSVIANTDLQAHVFNSFVVRSDFADQYPDAMTRFVRGLVKNGPLGLAGREPGGSSADLEQLRRSRGRHPAGVRRPSAPQ
jgi:sulfonate transport system substrate-binding protein